MRSRTTMIAGIMLGVACCGALFHLLRLLLILVRMPGMGWLGALLISTPGPVIGAIVQRYRGGFIVLGGVIGGMVWNVGLGVIVCLWWYFSLRGTPALLPADPGFILLLLAGSGAVVGLVVGIVVWSVMSVDGPWSKDERNV